MYKDIVVIHHVDADGHCAAAIVGCLLGFNRIQFIPMNYSWDLPNYFEPKNKTIYIVDYSLEPEIMDSISQLAKKVIWLDHHKTAIDNITKYYENTEYNFINKSDINKSGSLLTWKYCFPNLPIPNSVNLIDVYDRWKWHNVDDALEFHFGLLCYDTRPKLIDAQRLWRSLLFDSANTTQDIIAKGRIILSYNNMRNAIMTSSVEQGSFFGYNALFINTLEGINEICSQYNSFAFDIDIFVGYMRKKDKWYVSLRTTKSDIDVSELAKRFGGGGHPKASGFVCEKLPKGCFFDLIV